MKQTKAPQTTPSPHKDNKASVVGTDSNPTTVFISMVLDMSWRLALVVLIPLIGGNYLDNHHKSGHLYLIIGAILAAFGGFIVVYRSYLAAKKLTGGVTSGGKK